MLDRDWLVVLGAVDLRDAILAALEPPSALAPAETMTTYTRRDGEPIDDAVVVPENFKGENDAEVDPCKKAEP